ncbi:MAG TPA: hypothetical protein VEB00_05165 [Clostridia bacterium]|nr:hypothetical protein [Clostridia bacterium]
MYKSDDDDPHKKFGVIKGGGKDTKKKESFEDHLSKHIETPSSHKNRITHSGGTDPEPKEWSHVDDPRPD